MFGSVNEMIALTKFSSYKEPDLLTKCLVQLMK